MEEVTWTVTEANGNVTRSSTKKLAYVSPWASFSKLPEEEKAKVFNAMRGALIQSDLMENGK